jgi:mono/diheme cytochrome c family protein
LCLLLIAASCQQNDSSPNQATDGDSPEPTVASGAPTTAAVASNDTRSSNAGSALAVFEKRILPIFQAAKPSSCTECHLSGVDLKDYIQPDQGKTFASLVSAELIDVKNPDDSKILRFINRRPDEPNLITDKVRQQEHDAFQAWIRAAVKDPNLLAAKSSAATGPQLPDEVIRHARKDRVLSSFIENVWTEVGRCAACHSPDQNQKQVKEHGEQVSWITLRNPEATLNHMVDAGIINADEPLESMLLTKPTMQVDHGGGQKMVVGDRTYKQFRRFIDDYASVVDGKYKAVTDIPDESDELSVVTDIWFKITEVPAKYDKMLLQADLYRWNGEAWSEHRVASSDRLVFGKGKLWQHSLSLTAPRGSEWADEMKSRRLPAGRYLVKLYIDQTGKLQKDFWTELDDEEFVGQVEIESRWPSGYGKMTVVRFPAK